MGKINLDETYIFKSALKYNLFDVTIGIKILFFRISVTIELGLSLLQFVTTPRTVWLKWIPHSLKWE